MKLLQEQTPLSSVSELALSLTGIMTYCGPRKYLLFTIWELDVCLLPYRETPPGCTWTDSVRASRSFRQVSLRYLKDAGLLEIRVP